MVYYFMSCILYLKSDGISYVTVPLNTPITDSPLEEWKRFLYIYDYSNIIWFIRTSVKYLKRLQKHTKKNLSALYLNFLSKNFDLFIVIL